MEELSQEMRDKIHNLKNSLGSIYTFSQDIGADITKKNYDSAKESLSMLEQIALETFNELKDILQEQKDKHEAKNEVENQVKYETIKNTISYIYNKNLPAAKSKNLELYLSNVGDLNKEINYSSSLKMILDNLVNNAIKFTDYGYVKIEVNTEDDLCIYTVEDTGRGISKNDQKNIFQEFAQTNKEDSKSGYGIGLSSVYREVKKLDGEISLWSELNRGTIISVSIDKK